MQLAAEACNAKWHGLVQLMFIRRRRRRAGGEPFAALAWIGPTADRSVDARGRLRSDLPKRNAGYVDLHARILYNRHNDL